MLDNNGNVIGTYTWKFVVERYIKFELLEGWDVFRESNVVAVVQAAYEQAGEVVRDSRNIITHLQVVDEETMEKMAELNMVATLNPWCFKAAGLYEEIEVVNLGEERAANEYPVKTFMDQGVHTAFATDYGSSFVYDPIECFHIFVTRMDNNDDPATQLNADEIITHRQAIGMMTAGGAWQMHKEETFGTLEVVRQADLVILSNNLLETEDSDIMGTAVLGTMYNGIWTYTPEKSDNDRTGQTGVLTKIADNLYEGTFDKLDYDAAEEYFKSAYLGNSGCSVIYKDGMMLRNFDWYINMNGNDNPAPSTIVIHTTADDGRYATVGVGIKRNLNESNYQSLSDEEIAILPFMALDIMNSEGLMVAESSVPGCDYVSITDGNQGKAGTYAQYVLMRGIADYCKNVDEAIEYMQSVNYYALDLGYGDYREEVHFQIADRNDMAIIEYVDNEMKVLRSSDLEGETWMTNHYRYVGKDVDTGHGMGFERDVIIRDNYDSVNDLQSGMDLLEKIKYSNTYTLSPADEEHFWWSEYAGYYDIDGDGEKESSISRETPHDGRDFLSVIKTQVDLHNSKENALSWWTEHSTVFDSNSLSMLMCIHEQYDQTFSFAIQQEN